MTTSDTGYELDVERQELHIIEWNHLDLWKFYPMALASSWSVRCLLYPMSVVKSRLQLQKQNNVYRGMCHAFTDIVKTEGFGALYRGFWVTVPQISASFIYSSVYEKLRDELAKNANITSPPIVSALAGGVASTSTQLIFVPTDIVAQYMMIHQNSNSFSGGNGPKQVAVFDMLKTQKTTSNDASRRLTMGLRVIRAIYKVDGLNGFYRGFFSSVILYIPSSMVFWGTYYSMLDLLTRIQDGYLSHVSAYGNNWWKIWRRRSAEQNETLPHRTTDRVFSDSRATNLLTLQAFSGTVGGIAAAVFTNPLEIIRIRIQMHRTSFLETVRRLVKYEGLRVFTKGLAPRMINNGIYSCLVMIGYESVKRACVLPEYKNSVVW